MPSPVRPESSRRHHRDRCAIAATLLTASLGAHAGDFSIGAGAGLDRGKTRCVAQASCDHTDGFAKLFLTWRAADRIELQAQYLDAGRFDGGDTSPLGTPFGGQFKVSGIALSAGYRWTFMPGWSVKPQLGIASLRTRFAYAAPFAGTVSKTTTQPIAGLSLAYAATPDWQLSLDIDQTRFKAHTTRGSLRLVGVAAQYAF